MTQTITIRYRLYVDDPTPLVEVSEAYRDACNHISEYMFGRGINDVPSFRELHDSLYLQLRTLYGLKAQMAQSAMRTVLARYSTLITQIRDSEKAAEAWDKRKAELEARGHSQPPHDVTSPAGPSALTECETTGIKAGRPCQADEIGRAHV